MLGGNHHQFNIYERNGRNMVYLIIDTCVWVDLCKKFPEICGKLTHLIESKKVRLILPKIIVEEWNRQKQKIMEESDQSVHGMIKNAKALSRYMDPKDAEKYKEIIDRFQDNMEQVESIAQLGIRNIEELLCHSSTILLNTSDASKLQAVDFALEKKAPFGNKNSIADALIVFIALEYIAKEGLNDCIFISSNIHDFSSSSNQIEIHEDLKELFDKNGLSYFTNIGLAINEVESNLVNDEIIRSVDDWIRLADLQAVMFSISEKNRQFMEDISAVSRLPFLETASHALDEHNRLINESLKAAERFSTIQESLQLISEKNHQFMEDISAASRLSVLETASHALDEHNRLINESLKAAEGFSTIQKSLQVISEKNSQFMERIRAAGEFSAIQEAFRAITLLGHQTIEHHPPINKSSPITSGYKKRKKKGEVPKTVRKAK
jgi:hypothetical protein